MMLKDMIENKYLGGQ